MVSLYTVEINGTTYESATNVRYSRGINRTGFAQFQLVGLNAHAAPAEDQRVKILYGSTVVFDGWIRELKREEHDIDIHVTAADGLGEVARRDIPERLPYASQTEGAIFTDILS